MIVVDTSAIVAIAFAEPERAAFVQVLQRADRVLISAVSVVAARRVVPGRRGQRAVYKGADFSETDIASALNA